MAAGGVFTVLIFGFIAFILFCVYFIFKQIQFILVSVNLYKKIANNQEAMIKILFEIRDQAKLPSSSKNPPRDLDKKPHTDAQGFNQGKSKLGQEEEQLSLKASKEKKHQKLIEEKLDQLKNNGIFVGDIRFNSLEEAENMIIELIKERKLIKEKASDNSNISIECIHKNISYDALINSYQVLIDKINVKIKKIMDAFSPLSLNIKK